MQSIKVSLLRGFFKAPDTTEFMIIYLFSTDDGNKESLSFSELRRGLK